MDLSPDYDSPVTIKLRTAAYKAAAADLAAKQAAKDAARLTTTDAALQASTLQDYLDVKAKFESLGESGYVKIDFPRLDWKHLKEMARNLKGLAEKSIHARADETRIPQWERFRALQEHDRNGISVRETVSYVTTDIGAEEITTRQAKLAGLSDDDAEKVWRAIGPIGRQKLAQDLVASPNVEVPTPPTNAPARPNP